MNLPLVIFMGVSGTGKSTCGRKIATRFELPFLDADDLHTADNKRKMQEGVPLTNQDREPWMQAICEQLRLKAKSASGCVLAHSGLQRAHREQLRHCNLRTLFLHLEAPREIIEHRMSRRKSHFMPLGLLASQLQTLQQPQDEADILGLDASMEIEELIEQASKHADRFIFGR